jgi:hypothetical protein
MGQYYIAVLLKEKSSPEEPDAILAWVDPHLYGHTTKLTEQSFVGDRYIRIIECSLSPKGKFYKSRLVWAGDYADKESCGKNLYKLTQKEDLLSYYNPPEEVCDCQYIVNHSKKEYILKPKRGRLHPLSLLTAEGNGRGGGDYRGSNEFAVGSWARDVISMEVAPPEGFVELDYTFSEGWDVDSEYCDGDCECGCDE